MEELIGKSIRGFKFDTKGLLPFPPSMEKYIGQIGKIINVDEKAGDVAVDFGVRDVWYYPLDQVKKHLVEEESKPIISQKVYTPLEKLMNYLIQNQYYIGDGLLKEYKSLKEEEKELFFTIACRGIYGMSSESDAKKFIDEKFQ
jgi:hypothetical protein